MSEKEMMPDLQHLTGQKEAAEGLVIEATQRLDAVGQTFQKLVDEARLPHQEQLQALEATLATAKRQAIEALEHNKFDAVNDDVITRLKKLQASIEQMSTTPAPAPSPEAQATFDNERAQALHDFDAANVLYDEALDAWEKATGAREEQDFAVVHEGLEDEFAVNGVVRPEDIAHYENLARRLLKFGVKPDAIVDQVVRGMKKGEHLLNPEDRQRQESFA